MQLIQLFLTFFQIGSVSIGGGIASISIIAEHVVHQQGWLSMSEFTNLITIAEMTPGPISINAATFVGTQLAGLPGAIVATLGNILPSIILITILTFLYQRYKHLPIFYGFLSGLRPVISALILVTCISLVSTALESSYTLDALWISIPMILLGLVLLQKTKIKPLQVMFLFGILTSIAYTLL